jgi:HAD superfamily hydrolase (TIGR01509 family)
MVKAVIFDFFGVLAIRDTTSFRQAYFADDPEKQNQIKKLHDQLGLGVIGYDEFINELARIGGVDKKTVLEHTENYEPNQRLLGYIKEELKPKYKIGIISNAGDDWVLKILGSDNYKLFDDIVLSYKYSIIKPDPRIYELSADNLHIKPSESVFVDDIMTYCQGAEAVGMKTVWYKDFNQMKSGWLPRAWGWVH